MDGNPNNNPHRPPNRRARHRAKKAAVALAKATKEREDQELGAKLAAERAAELPRNVAGLANAGGTISMNDQTDYSVDSAMAVVQKLNRIDPRVTKLEKIVDSLMLRVSASVHVNELQDHLKEVKDGMVILEQEHDKAYDDLKQQYAAVVEENVKLKEKCAHLEQQSGQSKDNATAVKQDFAEFKKQHAEDIRRLEANMSKITSSMKDMHMVNDDGLDPDC